jgi:hypothetical protein
MINKLLDYIACGILISLPLGFVCIMSYWFLNNEEFRKLITAVLILLSPVILFAWAFNRLAK